MKNIFKNKLLSVVFAVVLAISALTLPAGIFAWQNNALAINTYQSKSHDYYNQLSSNSKRFYNAINHMFVNGGLKTGNTNFDLIANDVVTQTEVVAYSNGDKSLLVDFASAKDAFALDHPEVFYVDFDLFSLTIGTKGSMFYATIGTGRTNSYYVEGFNSSAEVEEAINYVENNTSAMVLTEITDLKTKIKTINQHVVWGTKYGFFSPDSDKEDAKNHIRSIYGHTKYNYSVCEGYAKTFKYICDKNNIPCVEVVGYLLDNDTGNLEPHAWNAVKMDNGSWYAVDCTANDVYDIEEYLLVGTEKIEKSYFEDGKVSENTFEFKYPSIATYNYGESPIFTNIVYENAEDSVNFYVELSYKGNNVKSLMQNNGYYVAMACKFSDTSNWTNPIVIKDITELINHNNGYSKYKLNGYYKVKFFITDVAPTLSTEHDPYDQYAGPIENAIAESDEITNEYYHTSVKITPTFASSFTFSSNGQTYSRNFNLPVEKTYEAKIVYSSPLKLVDETKPVTIEVTSPKYPNISEFVSIKNVVFDGNNTITFTFTPSQRYEHHYESYSFKPTNLTTEKSSLPFEVYASFKRKEVLCSKLLGGGKLYMETFATPTLIDTNNLNLDGWYYNDNGTTKGVVDEQRSQMALVVSSPASDTQNQINQTLSEKETNLLASQIYELSLNICSGLATIPNGSYVKLAFGFPEGYSYESLNSGVTFKVYHFKKDTFGNIDYENPEELNVVATEYGLIVETNNFSPFAIVATLEETPEKSVYAKTNNAFGQISSNGNSIISTESEQITYTITPDNGFEVDYLLFNGKDITKRITDGKITLSYSELKNNNTLVISFVQTAVKQSETSQNITNFDVNFVKNQSNFEKNQSLATPDDTNETPLFIYIIVPATAVVIVAGLVVAFSLFKKKPENT